jgi:hypothetical protein
VFPAGPVRVTLREQLPLAQLPVACTVDVPRGPVDVAERVQALASAAAAIENAPIMAVVSKRFFMVAVSFKAGQGCRCRSLQGECGRDVSPASRVRNDFCPVVDDV